MLYAIFCYDREAEVGAWTRERDEALMRRHRDLMDGLAARGKLGPVARLLPTTTSTTLRSARNDSVVLDGPFAETKEQLLGFYVLDCESLEEVIEAARQFQHESGALEIRPLRFFDPGCGVQ